MAPSAKSKLDSYICKHDVKAELIRNKYKKQYSQHNEASKFLSELMNEHSMLVQEFDQINK